MKRFAIQDANILIDLIKISLLEKVLNLDFTFYTTDIIKNELNEEQNFILEKYVHSNKFEVISISADDLFEIEMMVQHRKKLSIQDCSALYFAQLNSSILLTGDRELRKTAEELHIDVRGIIWLIDQMVDLHSISKAEGVNYLKSLLQINKRIPVAECIKRIQEWSKK